MKPGFIHLLAAASFLCYADTTLAQGRAYAGTASVPTQPTNDAFLQMEIRTVQAAEVPERTAVEAPPYPGAVIIQTVPPAERISGRRRWTSLPVIILFTSDPVWRVVNFYRDNLEGWRHARYLSSDYFWLGEEDFNPLRESGQTVPSVQVRQARASKLVPDAVTEIHVQYRPSLVLREPGRDE
jgi:hypothetical protein